MGEDVSQESGLGQRFVEPARDVMVLARKTLLLLPGSLLPTPGRLKHMLIVLAVVF